MMAQAITTFPVPQMQEGVDDREALETFITDYLDYCIVNEWYVAKEGCTYDGESEDAKNQWKKIPLCMSTLRATLPMRMKKLIKDYA